MYVDTDPSQYLSYFKRAATYLSLNNINLAAQDFTRSIELNPRFSKAYEQRASIYIKEGRFGKARTDIERLRSIAGTAASVNKLSASLDEVEALVDKARRAEKRKKPDDCISYATKAVDIAPFFTELRSLRAKCHINAGNLGSAVADLQRIAQVDKADLTVYPELAQLRFYYLDEADQAISNLKTCLQSDPENKTCRKLFKEIKKTKQTMDQLAKELRKQKWHTCGKIISPPDGSPGLLGEVKAGVGEISAKYGLATDMPSMLLKRVVDVACESYSSLSRWEQALEFCSQALEFDADNVVAVLGKAGALIESEEFDAAISLLERAAHHDQQAQEKLHEAQRRKRMAGRKDYYKLLGVSRDSTQREIKRAYRKKAQEWHPDLYKGDLPPDKVQDKMAEINQAYEVLSNEETRTQYDQGEDPNDPMGGAGGSYHHYNPFGQPFVFHAANGQPFAFRQGDSSNIKFQFGGGGGGGGDHFRQFFEQGFRF
ncbi:hypothetical protein EV182_002448 [Spiromyces aspiralis]|uniref:Uncharacterized protein n=1 Tax=Spiromyces aspiralis TaxID=68401 RepID=A0ACC1HV93_9FUNG|nr:hypothetical protein EV182_002448 [Spiromyces aspiralis]